MEHVQHVFFCVRIILIIMMLRFVHVTDYISHSYIPSTSEHFLTFWYNELFQGCLVLSSRESWALS